MCRTFRPFSCPHPCFAFVPFLSASLALLLSTLPEPNSSVYRTLLRNPGSCIHPLTRSRRCHGRPALFFFFFLWVVGRFLEMPIIVQRVRTGSNETRQELHSNPPLRHSAPPLELCPQLACAVDVPARPPPRPPSAPTSPPPPSSPLLNVVNRGSSAMAWCGPSALDQREAVRPAAT